MRKLILLLIIFFSCTLNLSAQWVNIGPMDTAGYYYIYSLTGTDNYVFVGAYNYGNNSGLFFSSNNGLNWSHLAINSVVRSLVINGNNIYAALDGVYRSTNLGQNWTQLLSYNYGVYSLAVNGNDIYAGTWLNGLLISTNSGENWIQTNLNNEVVQSIAINNNRIYAGVPYHLYLSTNMGNNWDTIGNFDAYTIALDGNNVYAGCNGIYRSTNNGLNWSAPVLSNQRIECLAVYNNNIFAGTLTKVYYSWNMGENWIQLNDGMDNCDITALYISNDYVYAGSNAYSVYRRPLSDFTELKKTEYNYPDKFSLSQNYPNPFNPVTKIKFEISEVRSEKLEVRLVIYDPLGREIATLINDKLAPGTYEVEWNGSNYTSGVYFYKLEISDPETSSGLHYSETKKMVLIK